MKVKVIRRTDPTKFGIKLKVWRKTHKITQKEFAAMAGVSQAYISNIENAKGSYDKINFYMMEKP